MTAMKTHSNRNQKLQSSRFIKTARELDCDEDEDPFNATLKRIVPVKSEKDEKPMEE